MFFYSFLAPEYTCMFFPIFCSLMFGLFFLLNLVLWAEGSSAAVPFGTLVAVLALWFCVSTPLTFVGAYFGFKRSVSYFKLHVTAEMVIRSSVASY